MIDKRKEEEESESKKKSQSLLLIGKSVRSRSWKIMEEVGGRPIKAFPVPTDKSTRRLQLFSQTM
jgi:hypothetical protein